MHGFEWEKETLTLPLVIAFLSVTSKAAPSASATLIFDILHLSKAQKALKMARFEPRNLLGYTNPSPLCPEDVKICSIV
ncbi:hypothetical protein EJ110_NYTH58143 [Nymphaea thermarum]|nr:hypothetical protein EJ110_NYTH58143 [Nymphaea thermarum]